MLGLSALITLSVLATVALSVRVETKLAAEVQNGQGKMEKAVGQDEQDSGSSKQRRVRAKGYRFGDNGSFALSTEQPDVGTEAILSPGNTCTDLDTSVAGWAHNGKPKQGGKCKVDGIEYTLREYLGAGDYGEVWMSVKPAKPAKAVAIKILNDKGRRNDGDGNEFEMQKLVKSPHVIEVLGSSASDGVFVLESMGKDSELWGKLAALPSGQRMTENQARIVLNQLVDGLEACHAAQVTHRDLKPENIFCNGEVSTSESDDVYLNSWRLDCKIGDFGFASRFVPGEASLKEVVGTPGYIAPEVLNHQYEGPPSDIFALGVTLYTMVRGLQEADVWGNLEGPEKWWKEMTKTPEEWKPQFSQRLPESLGDLLTKMLAKESERATLEQIKQHQWLQEGGVEKGEACCCKEAVEGDCHKRIGKVSWNPLSSATGAGWCCKKVKANSKSDCSSLKNSKTSRLYGCTNLE